MFIKSLFVKKKTKVIITSHSNYLFKEFFFKYASSLSFLMLYYKHCNVLETLSLSNSVQLLEF